jgi:hypothetical protein
MSALDVLESGFRWMADHGIWDFITALAVIGIALVMKTWSRRPMREVSIHVTHSFDNDHSLFPNTLGFEVRNLLDAPIIITRPNFRFSKHLSAGSAVHGNTATGDVEIKFRILMPDGNAPSQLSHVTAMLRHREGAYAYVPIQDSLSEDEFLKIANSKTLGTLELQVVLLGESPPRSVSLKMPIQRTQRAPAEPSFGFDGVKSGTRRLSASPPPLPSLGHATVSASAVSDVT